MTASYGLAYVKINTNSDKRQICSLRLSSSKDGLSTVKEWARKASLKQHFAFYACNSDTLRSSRTILLFKNGVETTTDENFTGIGNEVFGNGYHVQQVKGHREHLEMVADCIVYGLRFDEKDFSCRQLEAESYSVSFSRVRPIGEIEWSYWYNNGNKSDDNLYQVHLDAIERYKNKESQSVVTDKQRERIKKALEDASYMRERDLTNFELWTAHTILMTACIYETVTGQPYKGSLSTLVDETREARQTLIGKKVRQSSNYAYWGSYSDGMSYYESPILTVKTVDACGRVYLQTDGHEVVVVPYFTVRLAE